VDHFRKQRLATKYTCTSIMAYFVGSAFYFILQLKPRDTSNVQFMEFELVCKRSDAYGVPISRLIIDERQKA
ncbi:MAG: hypothetical protein JSV56_11580, partial [Methanomassiliicoccales archaeon]